MFEYTLASVKKRDHNKELTYFIVTSILWFAVLSGSILASIFLYDAHLDDQLVLLTMIAAPPPPPPPPPPPSAQLAATSNPTPVNLTRLNMVSVNKTPDRIELPDTEKAIYEQASLSGSAAGGMVGGVEGGVEGGVIGGVLGGVKGGVLNGVIGGIKGSELPPPPPPEQVEQPKPQPHPQPDVVRRSEGVIRGNAIDKTGPSYPPLARNAQVQGDVVIEILIDEYGNVVNAQVVNGHALLQQAALSAAWKWKFKPTLLNNEPVKVKGIITFRFYL